MGALALVLLLTGCADDGVETVAAQTGNGVREIVAYGTLTPCESVPLNAEKGALVTAVFAEVGDGVAAGERLLTVEENGVKRTLSAPCRGVVAEVASVGAVSDGKRTLAVVMDATCLTVTPLLSEEERLRVKVGDEATVTALASGQSYPARLTKTYALPETDGEGRYRVRLELSQSDETLLPGMTVRVTLYAALEGVLLPHTAVGWDEAGYYARTPSGERLALSGADYCRQGYAVSGIPAGTLVARFVEAAE